MVKDDEDRIVLRHVAYCGACHTYLEGWSTDIEDAEQELHDHQEEWHD